MTDRRAGCVWAGLEGGLAWEAGRPGRRAGMGGGPARKAGRPGRRAGLEGGRRTRAHADLEGDLDDSSVGEEAPHGDAEDLHGPTRRADSTRQRVSMYGHYGY